MRQPPVLLGFALILLSACRAASPGASAVAARPRPAASTSQLARAASARPVESAHAPLGGCHAEPATVYGQEAVTFVIEGAASPQPLVAQLVDERGAVLRRVTLSMPGAFHPEGLGSGDFRLRLGSGSDCVVTINRELSRGSAGETR